MKNKFNYLDEHMHLKIIKTKFNLYSKSNSKSYNFDNFYNILNQSVSKYIYCARRIKIKVWSYDICVITSLVGTCQGCNCYTKSSV